jgi:hypothetical protein
VRSLAFRPRTRVAGGAAALTVLVSFLGLSSATAAPVASSAPSTVVQPAAAPAKSAAKLAALAPDALDPASAVSPADAVEAAPAAFVAASFMPTLAPKSLLASSTSTLATFRNKNCQTWSYNVFGHSKVCVVIHYHEVSGHPVWFRSTEHQVLGTPCDHFDSLAFEIRNSSIFDSPGISGSERWFDGARRSDCTYTKTIASPPLVHSGNGFAHLYVNFRRIHLRGRLDPQNISIRVSFCRPSQSGCNAVRTN